MSELPKWIKDLKDYAPPGYFEALSIMWEALEYYKSGGTNIENSEDAMRRIEELGK